MARTDVVVVGGGIGGLTCAAFLARQGIAVQLFERDDRVGGLARSIKLGDWLVPANLGRTDGFGEGDAKARILGHLDLLERLRPAPLPTVAEIRVDDGYRLVLPAGLDAARDALCAAFPEEARGIRKALAGFERVAVEVERLADDSRSALLRALGFPLFYPTLFRLRGRMGGEFVRAAVRLPRARTALAALAPLVGTSVDAVAATAYGLAAVSALQRPVVLPGGGRRLAQALAEVARSDGATVRLGTPVDAILIDGRAARGVRAAGEEHPARVVVANAPPLVTFGSLVPRAAVHAGYLQQIGQLRASASACVLLLALRGRRAEFDAGSDLVLVHAGDDLEAHERALDEDSVAGRTLAVALRTPERGGDGAAAGDDVTLVTVVVPDRTSRWATLGDEVREQLASETAATLTARLGFLHPDLAGRTLASRLLTPLDLAGWSGDPEGSRFGWEQTPSQTGSQRLAARTPVDGLLLAGAGTYPGGGYAGTLVSGFLAGLQAAVLLGQRVRM